MQYKTDQFPTFATIPAMSRLAGKARGVTTCTQGSHRQRQTAARIRLSQQQHGPPDDPRFAYANSPVLRAMKGLHLEFDRL
jgi:hypothetical protein